MDTSNDASWTDLEPWSREAAELYELIHGSDDFESLADRVDELVRHYTPAATSLLDVACGTGWYLERLGRRYDVEGVDLSPAMLDFARRRLPAVPLHQADMRDFDLGRVFDAVTCLSSSIAWMETREDLDRAVTNMSRHLSPGGVLLVEPWDSPEDPAKHDTYWVTTAEAPGRAVAMLETTQLAGDMWIEESRYLIWTPDGVDCRIERARYGAFRRRDHEDALHRAGLEYHYDAQGPLRRGLHIGVKRSA
jgi:SAM-dependent methyltransferase